MMITVRVTVTVCHRASLAFPEAQTFPVGRTRGPGEPERPQDRTYYSTTFCLTLILTFKFWIGKYYGL